MQNFCTTDHGDMGPFAAALAAGLAQSLGPQMCAWVLRRSGTAPAAASHSGAFHSRASTPTVKFAFDLFDTDGSGTIDAKEVRSLVTMVFANKKTDKKVKQLLKTIDADGDGVMSLQEFR